MYRSYFSKLCVVMYRSCFVQLCVWVYRSCFSKLSVPTDPQVVAVNVVDEQIPAFTDPGRIPQPKDMKGGSAAISERYTPYYSCNSLVTWLHKVTNLQTLTVTRHRHLSAACKLPSDYRIAWHTETLCVVSAAYCRHESVLLHIVPLCHIAHLPPKKWGKRLCQQA